MSTLNNYTTATRPAHAIGLCIFNTDTKAIEVSDGTNWSIYDYDSGTVSAVTNNLSAVFDGATDKLDCGTNTSLMPTGGLTLSGWIKQASGSGDNNLIQRQTLSSHGYSMRLNGGVLYFYGTGGHTFGSGFTSTTDWYHLCITHDNSTVKGYVNGVLQGSSSTTSLVSNTVSTKLGWHTSYTPAYLEGKLDECAIFSSALDASNVLQIYNEGNPIDLTVNQGNYNSSSDLIAYWRMGDGASDTSSGGGSPASGNVIGTVVNLAGGYGNATVTGGSPEYINDAP
jgi:hypothetical protein